MSWLLCVLLLCPWMNAPTPEEDLTGEIAAIAEVYTIEQTLSPEEQEAAGEMRLDGSYDIAGALRRLWTGFLDRLFGSVREKLGAVTRLVAIAALCALCSAISPEKRVTELTELAGCCTAALALTGGTESALGGAIAALDELSAFSKVALPVFFTTAAAGGAVASSSARYAAVCLAADVYMTAANALILPAIRAFLALSISASLFDGPLLRAAARAAKWCAVTAMTLLTMGFGAYLSISGAIAGSADALAVKTTRTLISTALPVVGGILSDLSGSLLGAATLVRQSTGAFTLAGILAVCIAPVALLLGQLLCYKAAAAAAELLCGGNMAKLLTDTGTGLGLLLGLVGSYAAILFLAVASGLRAVVL